MPTGDVSFSEKEVYLVPRVFKFSSFWYAKLRGAENYDPAWRENATFVSSMLKIILSLYCELSCTCIHLFIAPKSHRYGRSRTDTRWHVQF